MALRFDLLLSAERDAHAAQDWYDDMTSGLGEDFTDEYAMSDAT